ncbi:hypothetical protein FRC12_001368 [Ceratobasidium sp. 428]|nr:hypothetical protein FRC09_015796 [Ceratobasidium sp. 395]KAG8775611.1 hypothetical protein FRC12_001368 [Ceratobasidium sp. 428]
MSVQADDAQHPTAPATPPAIVTTRTNCHLIAFFSQYSGFQYDPSQSVVSEFKRLKQTAEWRRGHINRNKGYKLYNLALVLQFNETYGIDGNDLASWQNLCRVVRVQGVPGTVGACKKAIKKIHVNLVDLVDQPNTRVTVKRFKNRFTLSEYSVAEQKIFPKNWAKAGGILKHLLRQILFYTPPSPQPGQAQARAQAQGA